MPARSKAQQQAAGAELERRRQGRKPQRFKGLSRHELEKFAETTRKGLPARARNKRGT